LQLLTISQLTTSRVLPLRRTDLEPADNHPLLLGDVPHDVPSLPSAPLEDKVKYKLGKRRPIGPCCSHPTSPRPARPGIEEPGVIPGGAEPGGPPITPGQRPGTDQSLGSNQQLGGGDQLPGTQQQRPPAGPSHNAQPSPGSSDPIDPNELPPSRPESDNFNLPGSNNGEDFTRPKTPSDRPGGSDSGDSAIPSEDNVRTGLNWNSAKGIEKGGRNLNNIKTAIKNPEFKPNTKTKEEYETIITDAKIVNEGKVETGTLKLREDMPKVKAWIRGIAGKQPLNGQGGLLYFHRAWGRVKIKGFEKNIFEASIHTPAASESQIGTFV